MNKETLFNTIDDILQDCYNETIDREDYDFDDLLTKIKNGDELARIVYNNVELFALKLKNRIEDETICL